MILTRKFLKAYQESMRISISEDLEKELLDKYRQLAVDDEGHVHDYTEQDLCEQLRKILL